MKAVAVEAVVWADLAAQSNGHWKKDYALATVVWAFGARTLVSLTPQMAVLESALSTTGPIFTRLEGCLSRGVVAGEAMVERASHARARQCDAEAVQTTQ